jgi:hypothetical protein
MQKTLHGKNPKRLFWNFSLNPASTLFLELKPNNPSIHYPVGWL